MNIFYNNYELNDMYCDHCGRFVDTRIIKFDWDADMCEDCIEEMAVPCAVEVSCEGGL